jgi:hypothetical protein
MFSSAATKKGMADGSFFDVLSCDDSLARELRGEVTADGTSDLKLICGSL